MNPMESGTRGHPAAAAALGTALIIGVLADLLLRTERVGINLWILSLAFQFLVVMLHRRYHTAIPWTSFALLLASGGFLLSFAWRDSPALNAMAFVASIITAGLAAWVAQGASLRASTTMQYVVGISRSAGAAMIGVLPLALHHADWTPFRRALGASQAAHVGRGIALAIPPVVLFGALLASADPIFNSFYSRLFRLDLEAVALHGVIIGCVAWAVAGFLRDLVIPGNYQPGGMPAVKGSRMPFTESMLILGSVTLVFLLFVAIQLRTLFGGDAFVLAETGLTYAEYARQGFFHMAWAAALVLPFLLFLEWIGRREGIREHRSFRALATLLLGLLGLVLLSAVHRMRIYQASYGLTELRVYTVAFMAWLGPVLAWFGLTVLAGRRERFIPGVLSLGLLAIVALHLINPDQLIARVNLERAARGLRFDVRHAISLSDDAGPVLARAMTSLAPADQCVLLHRMQRSPGDWRSWNLSRWRMRRVVEEMEGTPGRLKTICPKTTPS
jgi:hypothetical protein